MSQLWRIATRGRPTLHQFLFLSSITTTMPTFKPHNLFVFRFQRFYHWYVTLSCDLDLWPWTFVMGDGLWRDENVRKTWRTFNVWPYHLEHVSCLELCFGIIFTKFKFAQPIRSWHVTIFLDADTLCHVVTLTFDPLTLNICSSFGVSCSKSVRNFSEIMLSWAELLII